MERTPLKNSVRNCALSLSFKASSLKTEKSRCTKWGPNRLFRPTFPITPGGAGTQQALLVYALRHHRGLVLAFSVGMNITTVVVNLVLGFASIGLMLRTLRWRRLVARDRCAAVRRLASTHRAAA